MPDYTQEADKIIRDYAFGSSLTGFIPIPFMDTLGLISVQRVMLMKLSKLYDIPYSKNLAKTWITTLMTGLTARAASPLIGSTLKLIPGIGSLAGGASMAAMGSASTYAIGKVFQQHFESGGTLESFDPDKVKKALSGAFAEGQKISMRNK